MNRLVVGVWVLTLLIVALVECSVNIRSAAISNERPYYDDPFYYATDMEDDSLTWDFTAFEAERKSRLTYTISNYPVGIPEELIRSTIRRAFDAWSRVANVDFVETVNTSRVDIWVAFEGKNHRRRGLPCRYAQEETLAHTVFSEVRDIHFNTKYFFNDEFVSLNEFLNTAIHEIGHTLGLMDSNSSQSVMHEVQLRNPLTELQPEDVDAIQDAYGKRLESATTTSTTTPGPSTTAITTFEEPLIQPKNLQTKTNLCSLTSYDTIVRDHRGNICVLADRFYYNLNETNSPARKISAKWPGLPPNVDAAITYLNGKTYFFKDDEYWKYDQRHLQEHYPRPLAFDFPGTPTNIDAILLIKTGGCIVFKRSNYWLYDTRKPKQFEVYPEPIGDILGFSGRVDAALTTVEGRRFVFSGMKYYEVDENNKVTGEEGDVQRDWFNCY